MRGLYEIYGELLSDLEIYEKDDPYKEAKQLEVKRWFDDYFKLLFSIATRRYKIELIKDIFRSNDVWNKVSNFMDSGDIRLNRVVLGRKLVNLKDDEGNYLFFNRMRYAVACRCSLKEEIKGVFKNLMSATNSSREKVISNLQKKESLIVFWTYMINKDSPEISGEFKKLVGLDNYDSFEDNKQRIYEYGIKNAGGHRYLESLEFFWEHLPEKKGELLIEAALHASKTSSGNIISWCLRNLDIEQQRELAVKSLDDKYRFFWDLEKDHFWSDVKTALSHLKPSVITPGKYKDRVSFITQSIAKSPQLFIRTGIQLLKYLWDLRGFDEHRQYYLNSIDIHSCLEELLGIGETEIAWHILNAANEKQFKKFMGSYGLKVLYSDLRYNRQMDYLIKLFDYFKKRDRLAVEQFLKKEDPKNLDKIMDYIPDSSHQCSYLTQNSTAFNPDSQTEQVACNINIVTQHRDSHKRNFCHYPLL